MNKSDKRKSLSNWAKSKVKGKENEPPDNDLMEANDDEAERREKRKSRLLQLTTFDSQASQEDTTDKQNGSTHLEGNKLSRKISTAIGKTVIPVQSKAAMDISFSQSKKALSNDQLTNLYAECIKLCSENKITQKNTWDLSLIDYINDVIEVQKERDQDMTNFQAASVTLDASVKIYSCRVDSVHSETYKVLGGLNRTAVGQDPTEEQGQPEEGEKEGEIAGEKEKPEGEEENEQKAKKRQKKISEGVNTLETNLENISIKQFDMGFDVDPLFKKTSAAFDEGGAKGLLLNHLSVYRNCELIFDSSDAVDENQTSESTDENLCDISELQKRLLGVTRSISSMEICPTFTHFQFSKPDKVDEELENGESMAQMNFDEQFSDEDVPAMPAAEDDVDEHQQAIQQEQQLMEEIINQDDNEDGNEGNALGLIAPNEGVQKNKKHAVSDLPEFLMTGDVDLSTIDPKLLSNWAGPNHWKFKAGANKEAQPENAEKKRGKKKEAFFINWTEPDDTNYEEYFAPPGRAATTLSAQIQKKAALTDNLLPPDIHYDIKMFTQLFTKPKWRISLTRRRKAEASAANANQENEGIYVVGIFLLVEFGGEGGDYMPQPLGQMQDDSDNEHDNNFVISAPPLNDLGELELIAEPRKVEQIKIDFAKTSKFVDVRALKDSIWKELKTDNPQKRKSLEKQAAPKNSSSFSEVLESLPSTLPTEVMKNVNVPFAFICLLHLANEKGLEISQEKDNLSELFIQIPEK